MKLYLIDLSKWIFFYLPLLSTLRRSKKGNSGNGVCGRSAGNSGGDGSWHLVVISFREGDWVDWIGEEGRGSDGIGKGGDWIGSGRKSQSPANKDIGSCGGCGGGKEDISEEEAGSSGGRSSGEGRSTDSNIYLSQSACYCAGCPREGVDLTSGTDERGTGGKGGDKTGGSTSHGPNKTSLSPGSSHIDINEGITSDGGGGWYGDWKGGGTGGVSYG